MPAEGAFGGGGGGLRPLCGRMGGWRRSQDRRPKERKQEMMSGTERT